MTTPGPDRIILCPACGAAARQTTYGSISFHGPRTFSDGLGHDMYIGRFAPIACCATCIACYWLHEATEVDPIDPWNAWEEEGRRREARWAHAPRVAEPTEEQYLAALAQGQFCDAPARERGVRMLAWWKHNDAVRYYRPEDRGAPEVAPALRENLARLAALLDEGLDEDVLLRAEIHRALGEFDEARALLARVVAGELADVARRMEAWCAAGDRRVHELTENDPSMW